MNQQKNMECGTEDELHATERPTLRRSEMRSKKRVHQKARAMTSPDVPSRREVEDDNLTHIPFRSWRNHFLRGRGRKSGHRRRHNEGQM